MIPCAVSNILWPKALEEAAWEAAAAGGLRGIEVAPTRIAPWDSLDPQRVRDYRYRLNERGLSVPAMQALFFGRADVALLADEDSFLRMKDHLELVARTASFLDADNLVFGAPKARLHGSLGAEEAFDLAKMRLRILAETVSAFGVRLVLEAVVPAFGCDFITTTEQAAQMVRAVDHEGLRLHLDMGTVLSNGEDAGAIIRAHGDILAHVHLSRPALAPVTEACAADRAMAQALRDIGYNGWISIEIKPQDEALTVLRQAASVAAEL